MTSIDILILRDPRESTAKCSLTPIRGAERVRFVHYDKDRRVDVGHRVLLDPDGELLTQSDAGSDLLLIDCSWRRVPQLRATLDGELVRRRLPVLRTAYPRRSKTHPDPTTGLASIEALYAATLILGDPRPDLLESYRWRDEFLERNRIAVGQYSAT